MLLLHDTWEKRYGAMQAMYRLVLTESSRRWHALENNGSGLCIDRSSRAPSDCKHDKDVQQQQRCDYDHSGPFISRRGARSKVYVNTGLRQLALNSLLVNW
eukprot:8164-Heterococcus_DN1.PRE.13